jgi:hypothetical protein
VLPARRIVCLFYKIRDKGVAAVLEAKNLPTRAGEDASTDPYVYQAVGQGYFFDNIQMGTHLVSYPTRDIGFMVVTQEGMADAQALADALLARSQK